MIKNMRITSKWLDVEKKEILDFKRDVMYLADQQPDFYYDVNFNTIDTDDFLDSEGIECEHVKMSAEVVFKESLFED